MYRESLNSIFLLILNLGGWELLIKEKFYWQDAINFLLPNGIEQGSTNFLCKGLDSQSFYPWKPIQVCQVVTQKQAQTIHKDTRMPVYQQNFIYGTWNLNFTYGAYETNIILLSIFWTFYKHEHHY